MEAFDDQLHDHLSESNEEHECTECGKPIEKEGVCSRACFNSSMI